MPQKRVVPAWLKAAREGWTNTGATRPSFAVEPEEWQESVWDYPRPPAFVPDTRLVEVSTFDGSLLASTRGALRVLETSQAPAFYVPPESVTAGALQAVAGSSFCEWKGEAEYVALSGSSSPIGWRYPHPFDEFAPWAGWVSFYPDRVACRVDGELARPMAGGFYGGWITSDVAGPFKGEPGTSSW